MKVIYGQKGTGKTKSIIDCANQALSTAKGHVVFITDTDRYAYDIKYQIRFLNVTAFELQNEDAFSGFIKGIVAANGDNEYIFIDGIARISGKSIGELQGIFTAMEKLEKDYQVKFVVTISTTTEDLPDFILKHIN